MKQLWDKYYSQITLGCLVALVTGLLSVGVWVGRLEAETSVLPDLEVRIRQVEYNGAQYSTDMEWIKDTLIEIKEEIKGK